MPNNIPTHGTISWGRRLTPAAIALGLALMLVLGFEQTAGAQSSFAQSASAAGPPLMFSNNFLVTGDYVVGGAYGMNVGFTTISGLPYTTGTINIPDADPATKKANPGITGTTRVPAGAQIVAALLYWETVEKVGVMPGGPGSGQKGFFGPIVNGVTQTYPITGAVLSNHAAVSFSNGGCSGTSTGKIVRAYRADVRGLLPQDANGNVLANGQYRVVLPSIGPNTPLTLGATLVIIFRVVNSPAFPLNAIAIYDGAFAPNATPNLTMSQLIQGFYDAATTPAWRLTHIVGAGKSNKFQTAYLNNVQLPNLYTSGQPFPGWYGNWDNTTWTSGDPRVGLPNTVAADSDTATTQVIAISGNPGCVSWGAVVFSTTANDFNHDGILKTWKSNQGYTDVATGQHVDLTGASINQQDVFIQLDHIVDQNTGTSFQPGSNALTMVKNALELHNVQLHITNGNPLVPGSDAIPQKACTDSVAAPQLCPYPNQLVTTFRAGFEFLKNQSLNYPDESSCETQTPPGGQPGTGPACIRQFAPAQKDSYRYGIFADSLGAPDWTLQDGTLVSVGAKGTTVTITTATPHNLVAGNQVDGAGRVTIVDAITNPALNGTYFVQNILSPTSFTIQNTQLAKTINATYTHSTDPNLGVASGKAGKRSGTSDRGGSGMLISLGSWGPDGQKVTVQAGTILHEMGHLFGLGHGGTYPTNDSNNPFVDEPNCKSNYQSVMNYRFQVDLLDRLDPIAHQFTDGILDFSKEELQTLNETSLGGVTALKTTGGADPFYLTTRWYGPPTPSQLIGINQGKKDYVQRYCDGTPISANSPFMYIQQGPGTDIKWVDLLDKTQMFRWQNNQDIDFDVNGSPSGVLRGFNDWANLDLRLTGATSSAYVVNGGFPLGGGGFPLGGGGFPLGGGGFPLGGGGFPLGGGASAGDISFETANSVTRPPRNLTAAEAVSPRTITLNWTAPTFGQIIKYKIYRSDAGVAFHLIATLAGNPPATMYVDNVTCNPGGYQYEVTAVILNPDTNAEQESVPSNIVPGVGQDRLTGCYTSPGAATSVIAAPSAPASAVHGSVASITWSLQDDFYPMNGPVSTSGANTLVAIGPLPNSCTTVGPTSILANGNPTPQSGASTFPTASGGNFTFNWDTDGFCAGSYTFQLTLDSGQTQTTTSALQLQIDVTDTDSTPHVASTSVPDATVGVAYSNTLTADGGVGALAWSIVAGTPPPGIVFNPGTHTLKGTPIVPPPGGLNFTAKLYNFTVQVTDSAGNIGTQPLTLRLITAVSLSRTDIATGNSPNGLISADFNADGKLDLAITNTADNTVSVLLGNGDGTFAAQPTLTTGSVPYSLIAGDFNNDGKLDLAVTNFADGAPSTVSIFIGNGDGMFAAGGTYAVGSGPISVVAGDFNGDGRLDLAVANQNDHSVSVLLGNGDGTFQPQMVSLTGGSDVAAVATGDFDGDGKLDLALTNPSSDTVSVLLGNGDGTFQAAVAYATGNSGDHPIAVSAVDFNGDGKLDLAVTNLNARTVAILLGNGNGTFKPRVTYPTTNGPFIGPSAITTGDFNGDGKVDLAITDQHDNTVSILLGNGDGTFQSPLEFPTGNLAAGVAAGDFNGDGRLDLAVADLSDNMVSVMLHLPQPPTNVTVSGVTTGQVALTWTPSLSTTIAGYNVYRGTTSGGPYTKINSATVTASGFTDITAVPGTTYYYVVTSVDPGSLESVFSNEVSATTP